MGNNGALWTKDELLDQMAISLGGFAAEELEFGTVLAETDDHVESGRDLSVSN